MNADEFFFQDLEEIERHPGGAGHVSPNFSAQQEQISQSAQGRRTFDVRKWGGIINRLAVTLPQSRRQRHEEIERVSTSCNEPDDSLPVQLLSTIPILRTSYRE